MNGIIKMKTNIKLNERKYYHANDSKLISQNENKVKTILNRMTSTDITKTIVSKRIQKQEFFE